MVKLKFRVIMEGVNVSLVIGLSKASRQAAKRLLLSDKHPEFTLTRSLLNLLHNAVLVGSLPTTEHQKSRLDANRSLVWKLLSPRKSLTWKRDSLAAHPSLAIIIASTCLVAG